jgi:very-short-patch-repair endonuclease
VEPIYYTCTDARCEQSEAEQRFLARVAAAGVPVVPQVKLGNNWVFDGAINGTKLLVEYHGAYWHTRPEVQERDARKQAWADAEGFQIVTIWEQDAEADLDAAVAMVVTEYQRWRAASEITDALLGTGGNKGNTPPAIRDHVYGDWRDRFLEVLSESGVVLEACIAAGISRKTAYQWQKQDPDFAEDWMLAKKDAADRLRRIYHRRAEQQSDRAMEYLLRTLDPEEYGEKTKIELTGKDGGPIDVNLTDAERARRIAAILAAGRARRAGLAVDGQPGGVS